MDVNCLDFPTSYLNTLRGGQQRPGEVGVIQAVELSRWLYTFHVKAVASKDIDGISLFMVDCRVAIQTWFKNKASKIGLCAMKRVFRAIFVSLKKNFFHNVILYCYNNKRCISELLTLWKASKTCRWCASVGGNGPVSRLRVELK